MAVRPKMELSSELRPGASAGWMASGFSRGMTANLSKPIKAAVWALIFLLGLAAGYQGGEGGWEGAVKYAGVVWVVAGLLFWAFLLGNDRRRQRMAMRNLLGAMEQSQSSVMIVNLDGRIEYANAGLCHQFGYSRRELVGRPWRDLLLPDTPPEAIAEMVANVKTGRSWQGEWPYRRGKGESYPVRCAVTPVIKRDGGIACFVAVCEDMTEIKRTEVMLRAAVERAEAGDRAKSRFLATMSHEVRTPLNGIVGFTSLLLDTSLTAEQREYVQTIRTSGEALIQLTSDILDFARIESDSLKLEPKPTSLRACVEDTLDLIAVPAAQKRVELLHWVDDSVPAVVMIDDARLRQVLANLVNNGVKFTSAGTVEVRVGAVLADTPELVGSPAQWQITFTVRDTGIGIAPEHHTLLFKPFSQVDESTTRRYGGTGLGLAISQNLVRRMGGEITFESASGQGSIFKFALTVATVPGMARTVPDLGGLKIALAARPGHFRDEFKRLAERWRVELTAIDTPAELAGIGWDIAFVSLDADLARHYAAEASGRLPWLAAKTYGLVSVGIESELRMALRHHFCQILNRPLHHDSVLGLLAGIKPSAVSEQAPSKAFGLNVLVVEDNLVNQRLVQKLLTNLGCKPTVAANGRIALDELARTQIPFDLVLMDLHMPELDGLGAIERIRAGEVGEVARKLWITVLTADARSEQKERVMAAGANDYLVKPVSLTELAAGLRRHIENRS